MLGYSNEEIIKIREKNNKRKKRKLIILVLVFILIISSSVAAGLTYYYKVYSKPYGKYDLEDYVKVGKYKNIPLENKEIKINKKQINKKIEDEVKKTATKKEVKTGEVKNGDIVIIDYIGKIDGKKIKDGTAKNTKVTIGAGEFVNGFESGLIGKKVGKEVKIKIKFPKDYIKKELAGKEVEYNIKIKNKEEVKIPKYNNDWVKEHTEYKNKKEYEKAIKNELFSKEEKNKLIKDKEALWGKVVDSSKVKKYPKKEVERIKKSTIRQYKMYAKQYKMSYKEFLENQMGMTLKEFKNNLESYAKDEVKQEEILYWIAKKEKINVSEKEYKKHIKEVLKEYGYTNKSFKKENGKTYEKYAGKLNIYSEIYKEKIKNYIYKKAKKM